MPYVHWEYADTFAALTQYTEKAPNAAAPFHDPKQTMAGSYKKLVESHMVSDSIWPGTRLARQLHVRRSLDQYQYHVLSNTKRQDKDQLVSRLFDRKKLSGQPVVMVVDQLWLWVLQDSKSDVSSFLLEQN